MVVPVLLVVALACLVLGVLLASSPWLIGSLAAGAVAAVVLYRSRTQIATAAEVADVAVGPGATAPATPAPVATAVVTGTSFAARRRLRKAGAPRSDLRVWVVDGRPAYHLGQCAVLDDLPAGIVPERIPLRQALEDSFVPCPTCEPTEERLTAGSAAAVAKTQGSGAADGGPEQVWVVDGRPRYHRPGCASVAGEPAAPIPYSQAVADGFTPCPRCQPDAVET